MGAKNINAIPFAHFHHGAESVGQMHAAGWQVISRCAECGLTMEVDLRVVIKVSGPQVTLWNRKKRCRRLGCPGHVEFSGKHPRRAGFDPLRIDLTERLP